MLATRSVENGTAGHPPSPPEGALLDIRTARSYDEGLRSLRRRGVPSHPTPNWNREPITPGRLVHERKRGRKQKWQSRAGRASVRATRMLQHAVSAVSRRRRSGIRSITRRRRSAMPPTSPGVVSPPGSYHCRHVPAGARSWHPPGRRAPGGLAMRSVARSQCTSGSWLTGSRPPPDLIM